MNYVRPDVYREVEENNIDDVIFQDPFQDEARKAKRNLVAVSFGALLVAALSLQVNGFLGLQTVTGATLGAEITKGLACIVVIYCLAGFALSAFVDYSAWKFRRERYLIKPYLELIRMLEVHVVTTGEQVKNATSGLKDLSSEMDMRGQLEFDRKISDSLGQLKQIAGSIGALHTEMKPLLAHWQKTVQRTRRLSWRLRARFASLWVLDILVPLVLAGFAVSKTYTGIAAVVSKIVGP
jgi:hypothetical protein